MSKTKFSENFGAKGYYIALVLCAVAIGISGYLYYRNTNNKNPIPEDTVIATEPDSGNIPVGATLPTDNQAGITAPSAENPTESTQKPSKIRQPLSGTTVSAFSMDALSYNQTTRDWRTHNGIDIAAEAGTSVCAVADGKVYSVFEDDTMGMTVILHHDGGYSTTYSSLDKQVKVKAGDTVTAGQTIGVVGDSALLETAIGDHLHFSVSCNGKYINPDDFLKAE